MKIISADKFRVVEGIIHLTMDDLHAGLRPISNEPYVLISGQGDTKPDDYKHLLNDERLVHWFASNAGFQHERLTAVPVGIEYRLSDEQEAVFEQVMQDGSVKRDKLVCDAAFAVHSWVEERTRCVMALQRNDIEMQQRLPYIDYLYELKRSMFVPCPIGNGIDTFRLWEALYMGCVPVVPMFIDDNIRVAQYDHAFYNELPVLWISTWDDFDVSSIDTMLFEKMRGGKPTPEVLDFEYWQKSVAKRLAYADFLNDKENINKIK